MPSSYRKSEEISVKRCDEGIASYKHFIDFHAKLQLYGKLGNVFTNKKYLKNLVFIPIAIDFF